MTNTKVTTAMLPVGLPVRLALGGATFTLTPGGVVVEDLVGFKLQAVSPRARAAMQMGRAQQVFIT